MPTKILAILVLSLALSINSLVEAKLVQIIHTNDLHSYFEGYRDGRGGYARVKTVIDNLKKEASAKGIEVLQLDAGDWGEGTSFFFTDQGANSIKALNMFGTEATLIGNHDHLLGGKVLGQQIRRANVPMKFLSANLVQTKEMELGDLVKPFFDVEKSGFKIRVIGLSTEEPEFQYTLIPGFILPAIPTGLAFSAQAKSEGVDVVIALTHLGQFQDKYLAKYSKDIDVIVGGHSHTRMDEVLLVKNKNNKYVPIVQAGSHGLAVGSLILDIQGKSDVRVVSYKLYEINTTVLENKEMKQFVDQVVQSRDEYFGGHFNDMVGESNVPLSGYIDGNPVIKKSCWGENLAKMNKEAVGADIGLHLAFFEGVSMNAGPVKFGDLVDNFPHVRNFTDPGWEISTFTAKGNIIKTILEAIIQLDGHVGVNFYGLTYKSMIIPKSIPYAGGRVLSWAIKINGEKIDDQKSYTVAIPTEVSYAVNTLFPKKVQKIMPGLVKSGKFFWPLMEEYMRNNSPIKCISN
ncbi:MAG: bifunctional metallophosphatase/5'-nucleotidase [Bacteriovorax sp.]|nr:bifunctional metallophosphatase/5'-nucleotidase [Bacteriovorax sp.]